MKKQPKYKRELRTAITENIAAIKNSYVLKDLYRVTDIALRLYDDEQYKTVTDAEIDTIMLFNEIIRLNDADKLHKSRVFITSFIQASQGRKGIGGNHK